MYVINTVFLYVSKSKIMNYIDYELKNGIGYLFFNRPEKYNAFNKRFLLELSNLLEKENKNTQLKVLIISGKGKAFSSGVDLKALLDLKDVEQARDFALLLENTSEKIYHFSKPVIAAINGLALGGGLGYATAADIRIMAQESSLGYPAVKLGAILPATCTVYLKNIIGEGRTKDLLLTGKMIGPSEAKEIGLVSYTAPQKELIELAEQIAFQLMEAPSMALEYTKRTVGFSTRLEMEAAKLYAADNFAFLSQTKEWQQRMKAFANRNKK
jgi:enoyl-CoA hydratase/carnithine racemase